jgi:hypothetical protein
MTKNVLFMVHGIGRHKDGWTREPGGPADVLEKALGNYPCFDRNKKLADYFDVVEANYDDIFDFVLRRWADMAQSLPSAPGFGWVDEVKRLLTKAGDDSNEFSHIGGDLLLYCGFELIARSVRLRVLSTIVSELHRRSEAALKSPEGPGVWSVLGHSMGTTVVFDSLYELFVGNWMPAPGDIRKDPALSDEQKNNLEAAIERLQGESITDFLQLDSIFMVSNTSRLLTREDFDKVLPVIGPLSTGHCDVFCNVDNTLDPVSKVKAFTIPAAWKKTTPLTVNHVHQANVHELGHYLGNPLVHRMIFSRLVPDVFGLKEFDDAEAIAKRDWTGFAANIKDEVKGKIEAGLQKALGLPANSISDLQKRMEEFRSLWKRLGGN